MRLREQIHSEDRHIIATRSMCFFSRFALLFSFFCCGSAAASAPVSATPSTRILTQSSVLIADAVSVLYLLIMTIEVFPTDWSLQQPIIEFVARTVAFDKLVHFS